MRIARKYWGASPKFAHCENWRHRKNRPQPGICQTWPAANSRLDPVVNDPEPVCGGGAGLQRQLLFPESGSADKKSDGLGPRRGDVAGPSATPFGRSRRRPRSGRDELLQQPLGIVSTTYPVRLTFNFSDQGAKLSFALTQPLLHFLDIGGLATQRAHQFSMPPVAEVCGQYLLDLIQRKAGPLCADDDTQNDESVGWIFPVSIGPPGNCME